MIVRPLPHVKIRSKISRADSELVHYSIYISLNRNVLADPRLHPRARVTVTSDHSHTEVIHEIDETEGACLRERSRW